MYSLDKPVFFTDAAKKKAKPIPAQGHYNPNIDTVRPKFRFTNMGKKPDKPPAWRIPKSDEFGPAPGQYDTPAAITKTQWHIKSPPKVWSEQRVCEFQQIAHRKKGVPGVGNYKKFEEGYEKQSTKSLLLRTLRQ